MLIRAKSAQKSETRDMRKKKRGYDVGKTIRVCANDSLLPLATYLTFVPSFPSRLTYVHSSDPTSLITKIAGEREERERERGEREERMKEERERRER